MSRNTPSTRTPLWWIFFWPVDSTERAVLEARADLVPLCRVRATSVDSSDTKFESDWDNYASDGSLTTAEKIAKRWADQIEYCVNVLGCTRNDQIAIQLHMPSSSELLRNTSDGLSSGPSTEWEVSTPWWSEALSAFNSAYGDPFAALADELVARGVPVQPAFCLMDWESHWLPSANIGGNANGTLGNGNWDDIEGDARWGTEVVLPLSANATKGGTSDRTLADMTFTTIPDVDEDWRNSDNIYASRELTSLMYMAASAAISGIVYDNARAAFPGSYNGGKIQCGNYWHVCPDNPSHPYRERRNFAAIEDGRLDVWHDPSFFTDYYDDCQCPEMYPDKDMFNGDPENPDGPFFGFDGTSWQESVLDLETGWKTANRAIWAQMTRSCSNSSVYDEDKYIPWIHWPDIGSSYDDGGGANYDNGYVYAWHAEDFQWIIVHLLLNGNYRGQIWSWDPRTQAAADVDTLTARLDAAYAEAGIVGGIVHRECATHALLHKKSCTTGWVESILGTSADGITGVGGYVELIRAADDDGGDDDRFDGDAKKGGGGDDIDDDFDVDAKKGGGGNEIDDDDNTFDGDAKKGGGGGDIGDDDDDFDADQGGVGNDIDRPGDDDRHYYSTGGTGIGAF